MEIWIRDQINAIAAALVLGVAFGAIYDIVRIIHALIGARTYSGFKRGNNKPRGKVRVSANILTFFLDIVFCILFTACFAILSYAFCDGRFRMFVLISAAAGFTAYIATLGRVVVYFTDAIVYYLKVAARCVWRIVMFPVKALGRAVKRIVLFAYKHTALIVIEKFIFMRRLRYTNKIKSELSAVVRFER